ncbi:MAG: trypsin-like serine protease, partial [bacterium]|nr:trypsin-like serine protease [bacterium]
MISPQNRILAVVGLLLLSSGCSQRMYAYGQDSLSVVFDRVHSAVVTLHTVGTGPTVQSGGRAVTEDGLGSGTVIDADGAILTAAHVVQTAERVAVEFFDGTVMEAHVESSDPVSDTALVRLDGKVPAQVRPAPLGDSDDARVGDRVFVVGAPLGVSHTLTVGVLSARRYAPSLVGGELKIEVFQTGTAINPGNSGGPLFDMAGKLIGVVGARPRISVTFRRPSPPLATLRLLRVSSEYASAARLARND